MDSRYIISAGILKRLESKIQKIFGFTVIAWDTPNESGHYRPTVERPGKDNPDKALAVRRYGKFASITSHAVNDNGEKVTINVNLEDLDADVSDKEFNKAVDPAELERERIARRKQFTAAYDAIKAQGRPPKLSDGYFRKKRIRPTSSVFMVDEDVYVPFLCPKTDEVIGCQKRMADGKFIALKGSTTTGAGHILNRGLDFGADRPFRVFLSESYSTACEVLEADPGATVICTAGLGNVWGYSVDFKKRYPAAEFVFVLDKCKQGGIDKQLERLEERINLEGRYSVQPCKHSPELAEATDFNDVAQIWGKQRTHDAIITSLTQQMPLYPEVVSRQPASYTILSHISRAAHSIGHDKPQSLKLYVSEAAFDRFANVEGLKKTDGLSIVKRFHEWLFKSAIANSSACHGVGLYKDAGAFVANVPGTKFINKNGNLSKSYYLRPVGGDLYTQIPKKQDASLINNLDEDFTADDLKELKEKFEKFYKHVPAQHLYIMLGYAVQAVFANFLDFRVQMWLTGQSGSGKSFMLMCVLNNLINDFTELLKDVTAPGVKQLVNENDITSSPVILIDEFLNNSAKQREEELRVLKMLRDAADNTEHKGLRGQSKQNHKAYVNKFSGCLTSTEHSLVDNQDLARFFVLDFGDSMTNLDIEAREALKDISAQLRPKFLKLLLKSAPKYKTMHKEIEHMIRDKFCTGPDAVKDSHKPRAWTALTTGLALVLEEAGIANPKEKALELLESAFEQDRVNQVEALSSGLTVTERIFDTEVFEGTNTVPLLRYLINPKNKRECAERFGIELDHDRDYNVVLRLRSSGKPFRKLFLEPSKVKYPIYDIVPALRDARDGVEVKESFARVDGKTIRVYVIKIPKRYIDTYNLGKFVYKKEE